MLIISYFYVLWTGPAGWVYRLAAGWLVCGTDHLTLIQALNACSRVKFTFHFFNIWSGGWGTMVSIVTMLLTGWSVVRIPVGERDFSVFQNFQTGSGAHPAFYLIGTGLLPWDYSVRGMKLTTDILLVLRLECSLICTPLILPS